MQHPLFANCFWLRSWFEAAKAGAWAEAEAARAGAGAEAEARRAASSDGLAHLPADLGSRPVSCGELADIGGSPSRRMYIVRPAVEMVQSEK